MVFLHLYLISKTFVIDKAGGIRTAYAGYGDIPLHLTQITKFAYDKLDNLNEPIYIGEKIKYPFAINLISGLLLRLTGAIRFSVLFPVMLFASANILLLYLIYKKLLGKSVLASLALIIFFFSSGFGAYSYIQKARAEHQNIGQFFETLTANNISVNNQLDAKYPKQNIVYNAPIDLSFLHQRPFFLGLFGFALLLLFLFRIEEKRHIAYTIAAGVIYGSLPIIHTHSFVAASITLASVWSAALFAKKGEFARKILISTIIGIIIAMPQMYYLLNTKNTLNGSADFAAFRIGWMTQPTIGSAQFPDLASGFSAFSLPYLKFTWLNLGILLPTFLIAIILIFFVRKFFNFSTKSNNSAHYWIFVSAISGLILFLTVELVKFQPWDFDNNKLLVYWQLFAAPLAIYLFSKLYQRAKIIGIISLTIFAIISLSSGVLDVIPRILVKEDRMPVIFDINARNLAQYIRQNIPENDIVLTGTSHLNPVSSLAGRDTLVGYPGWLWTRGINYSEREGDIKSFYLDPFGYKNVISKYNVKYILFDLQSIYDYHANQSTFDREFTEVFSEGQYRLYKISK